MADMKLVQLTRSSARSGDPIWVKRDAVVWLHAANAEATSTIVYFANDQSVGVAGSPEEIARLLEA
jgi:hypothetical protein